MEATQFDVLLRSLADPLGRRRLSRILFGLTVGGPLGVLGLAEADARGRKKKRKRRRRKQRRKESRPFCAGRNVCVDGQEQSRCDDGSGRYCICLVTAETADPFCGNTFRIAACSECSAEETCVDYSDCGFTTACAAPCPNPR